MKPVDAARLSPAEKDITLVVGIDLWLSLLLYFVNMLVSHQLDIIFSQWKTLAVAGGGCPASGRVPESKKWSHVSGFESLNRQRLS